MSIADKITSITGHLQDDYTALETLGVSVEDKNIENIKDMANQIYAKFPKTAYAEGSDITLSNTLKGKLDFEDEDGKKKIGYGQTEQDSRQGYNLCECKLATTISYDVKLTNNNNGTYTISGTNTRGSVVGFRINQSAIAGTDNLQDYENGTYTLDIGITNENLRISIMQLNTWTEYLPTGFGIRLKSGNISNATNTFILVQIKEGASFSTPITIKPMLVKGSYTESTMPSFEQYGASPSPSYPQDIEVVTGTIEVVERGKNEIPFPYYDSDVQDRNGVNWSVNENGTINASGTANSSSSIFYLTNGDSDIYLDAGTYKISTNSLTDANGFSIQAIQIVNGSYGTVYWNDMVLTERTRLRIRVIAKPNATVNVQNAYIMIEQGSTATTYEPYITPQTYQLSLGEYEFAKIGNYVDTIEYDVENDKVYKNEKFKKIDLSTIDSFTHISSWENQTAVVAYNVITHGISGYATVGDILCNRLIKDTPAHIASSVTNAIGLGDNANVFLSIEGLTTSSAYVNYFDNNPTYLYAPLETPTKEEITGTLKDQIKALYNSHSFTGTTIIEIDGQLPMIIKVRALKGE